MGANSGWDAASGRPLDHPLPVSLDKLNHSPGKPRGYVQPTAVDNQHLRGLAKPNRLGGANHLGAALDRRRSEISGRLSCLPEIWLFWKTSDRSTQTF